MIAVEEKIMNAPWIGAARGRLLTIYGSSQDVKPGTDIADGSLFIETDTHKIFMFDDAADTWREW